jgi:hypothetical protein
MAKSRTFTFEDVCRALIAEHGEQRVRIGMGYIKAPCLHPDHDDQNPSMSVSTGEDGRTLVHCHAGCDQQEMFDAPRRFMSNEQPPADEGALDHATECTLEGYAAAKLLPVEFLAKLGVTEQKLMGRRRLCIPYGDESVRYRISLGGPERFRWRQGSKPKLYGLMHSFDEDYVVLVEGESCAQTLWLHDIPAFGIPGAATWNDDRDAPHLEKFERIYLVVEPDEAGKKLRDRVAASPSIGHRLHLIDLGEHKDASDTYVAEPGSFKHRIETAMATAPRWTSVLSKKRTARSEAAEKRCRELAREPRILDVFVKDLHRTGVVGEQHTACLLYLATTSRLFKRPVSVIVKGPSSGGKSFVVEQVLAFFPRDAFYSLTAMSERALAYWDEDMRHRMLVLYEAAAMESDHAEYMLRSLLSEGCIRYLTVESTPEGLQPREIYRPGPTGLILTTTKISIHPENETRMLSLTVRDSPEQTRAVMRATARGHETDVDLGRWHALQEWIATTEEAEPHVPYAEALAQAIPPVATRLRRDFSTLLSLIRAHALLHRQTRDRNPNGRIIATIGDYASVRAVFAETLAEGLGVAASDETREVVQAVDALIESAVPSQIEAMPEAGTKVIWEERQGVPTAQVARYLRLDESTAWRRVQKAIRGNYLKNLETRPRVKARLVLGDTPIDDQPVLPPPERFA